MVKKVKETFPIIRLAHTPQTSGANVICGIRGVKRLEPKYACSVLVSYPYYSGWIEQRPIARIRSWIMDSGAFSVWNKGETIDLEAYTRLCKQLWDEDPLLTEIIALDVIDATGNSWRQTLKNTEYMWKKGVPAIPTFHYGESEDVLKGYAKDYPKVGVGGISRFRGKKKHEWADAVFSRVWPAKIHGFGLAERALLTNYPWHTVDASTWQYQPTKFGMYPINRLGVRTIPLGIRGRTITRMDLGLWVKRYVELEWEIQTIWKDEMDMLERKGNDGKKGARSRKRRG